MTEHVEDIPTCPSEGKSRGLHTKGEYGISEALFDDGLHALFGRSVVPKTPQDRPYFQSRAFLILQDSFRIVGQLFPF